MGPGKHICVKVPTHFRFNWGFNISFCTLSHNDNRLMDFFLDFASQKLMSDASTSIHLFYKASVTITVGALQNSGV